MSSLFWLILALFVAWGAAALWLALRLLLARVTPD